MSQVRPRLLVGCLLGLVVLASLSTPAGGDTYLFVALIEATTDNESN